MNENIKNSENTNNTNAQKTLLEAMNWRYATKKYDIGKKLDENTFNTLLEVLRLTPSSLGMQPWKFIVVENVDVRAKLKEAGFGQSQWTEASHLIVLCAQNKVDNGDAERFLQSIVEQRGVTRVSLDSFANNIFSILRVFL